MRGLGASMEYVLVGAAIVLVVIFVVRARRSRLATVVIQDPRLGVLNLAGASGEALAREDLGVLGPLFGTVQRSEGTPPACDVLLVYCDFASDGRLEGSVQRLRDIIRDSGAAIVVLAKNHPGETYLAAVPRLDLGHANMVMTLDRKGSTLPTFLARLFREMKRGVAMPIAWNQLAPQIPGADHGDVPGAIFACSKSIAFGAAQPGVAERR